MFAIQITEENLSKIEIDQKNQPIWAQHFVPRPYLNSNVDWYYVSGYVNSAGQLESWAALPFHWIATNFEYNAERIKTDWDQIVRL